MNHPHVHVSRYLWSACAGIGALTVVLAMVGKLFTSSAASTMYLYSAELLPTVARNAGMGLASVVARVGAMVAPYLVVIVSGALLQQCVCLKSSDIHKLFKTIL